MANRLQAEISTFIYTRSHNLNSVKIILLQREMESRLIYGSYPQVVMAATENERRDLLESIKNGVLLKDILEMDNLKDSLFILGCSG